MIDNTSPHLHIKILNMLCVYICVYVDQWHGVTSEPGHAVHYAG